MCGIWTCSNGDDYDTLAIEKISFTEYYILYSSSYDHILDLSEKGTMVSKNLIYIKKSDDEEFFVYLDYDRNSVYFLWNHAIPDSIFGDVELKRVTELCDEELQKQKKLETEEELKKSISDWIKQSSE